MADYLGRRERYLTLFKLSQCSWCKLFYTNEPFLCTSRKLQSKCKSFERLIEIVGWENRDRECDKYFSRIIDMMQDVEKHGIMAKCRDPQCGALNPNPQISTCWECGKTLCCPKHPDNILIYNMEGYFWTCLHASHAQKYYEKLESAQTDILCPKCRSKEKSNLYYNAQLFLLECRKCKHFFTLDNNILKEVKQTYK